MNGSKDFKRRNASQFARSLSDRWPSCFEIRYAIIAMQPSAWVSNCSVLSQLLSYWCDLISRSLLLRSCLFVPPSLFSSFLLHPFSPSFSFPIHSPFPALLFLVPTFFIPFSPPTFLVICHSICPNPSLSSLHIPITLIYIFIFAHSHSRPIYTSSAIAEGPRDALSVEEMLSNAVGLCERRNRPFSHCKWRYSTDRLYDTSY